MASEGSAAGGRHKGREFFTGKIAQKNVLTELETGAFWSALDKSNQNL
jgi:hypothetical protein